MGRLRKEREIPLSLFYLKYFLYLMAGVLLIGVLAISAFTALGGSGIIYYANYAQEQANAAYDQLLNADKISEDMIPDLCQYAVFSIDGRVISGNIENAGINGAWEAVQGNQSDFRGNYYKVIPRQNEYCVLQYKIAPQYKSETLRKYLLPPEPLFLVSVLVLIFLLVVALAIRFGYVLKKKLQSLIFASEKIENKELEFSIEPGNLKEVNMVLASMDHMRAALKLSLESQWKMEQTRKEQISALAHDLKTPLTIIRGNAELLYDTDPTADQKECIGYIEESSLQMQDYVQMLIEITKSNSSFTLQRQEVNTSEFLQEVQKQAKGLCAVKNIQLHWETSYKTPCLFIDSKLLIRAFSNVLSNAVEHTPLGGVITFKSVEENSCMVFSVSDTGSGFSPEALKHGAAQFYMDNHSRNSKSHYGIGLYVVDSVAKQHEGQLILENDKITGGAKVTIRIHI